MSYYDAMRSIKQDHRLWPNGHGCTCEEEKDFYWQGQAMCESCWKDLDQN